MTQRARDHLGRFGVWRGSTRSPRSWPLILNGSATARCGSAARRTAICARSRAARSDHHADAGHQHREHVEGRRAHRRRVVRTGRGAPPRPVPARRGCRAPRGHPAVREALRHAGRLRRHPARQRGSRRQPWCSPRWARGFCGWPRSGPRARSRTWSLRSTPARPARSSAPGRCWPRSRRRCSRPTRSGPAPSAAPGCSNPYLGLVNYTSNLRRLGWSDEDLSDGGSDALIDALVARGTRRTRSPPGSPSIFDAGADHVAVQLLTASDDELSVGYRRLAEALDLSP